MAILPVSVSIDVPVVVPRTVRKPVSVIISLI
jgi:hypothetical protein